VIVVLKVEVSIKIYLFCNCWLIAEKAVFCFVVFFYEEGCEMYEFSIVHMIINNLYCDEICV